MNHSLEPLEDRCHLSALPLPDHIVVVVEENHAYSQVIGSPAAPYINALARNGASFSHSYAVTHPSEPNYLALFSGGTQGITDDSTPHTFRTANLASQLLNAGYTFAGYSENLPATGSGVSTAGNYARKHNPWVNFTNVPASLNRPLTAFPADYRSLPRVSFVVPNLQNDMHDGSVQAGDAWLKAHLGKYVTWAKTHNSLLIVTWDEDDDSAVNQIPTVFFGPMVRPGVYAERINHYSVLRTLEDLFRLPHAGHAATARTITDVWKPAVP